MDRPAPVARQWLPLASAIAFFLLMIASFATSGKSAPYIQAGKQAVATYCSCHLTPAMVRQFHVHGLTIGFFAGYQVALGVVFASVCLLIGVLLLWRREANPMALFAAVMVVSFGVTFPSNLGALGVSDPSARWLLALPKFVGTFTLFTFCYLFPDGRFVPRSTAMLALVVAVGAGALAVAPRGPDSWPLPVEMLWYFGLFSTGIGAQTYRYRRISTPVQRQQTKWVVYGLAVALLGFLGLLALFGIAIPSLQNDPLVSLVGTTVLYGLVLLIPLSLAAAILHSGLWEIDRLLNRTLVYGALTVCVVGVYVLVVGGLGTLLQARGNLLISLLATGLVAVLFQPLRARLQARANRLLYGERDQPYDVITRLGRRLESVPAPEEVLPAIVETVAHALKLPHASIWLADEGLFRIGAAAGRQPCSALLEDMQVAGPLESLPSNLRHSDLAAGPFAALAEEIGVDLLVPVSHGGHLVGVLALAPRGAAETWATGDLQLLRHLAGQVGATLGAVRLSAALHSSLDDLRVSRERLVIAQEEERRRIQRDLHDGLGPTLASIRVRLEACLDLAEETSPTLTRDLERLDELVGRAAGEIRRLVHDLRPPILDQFGLAAALRQYTERLGRESGIAVRCAIDLDRAVPAAVEVAILRIVEEALVNVQKHARAERVAVSLRQQDGWLLLEVTDDGRGLPVDPPIGRGPGSMRERAELLGGTLRIAREAGTRVEARIPVGQR